MCAKTVALNKTQSFIFEYSDEVINNKLFWKNSNKLSFYYAKKKKNKISQKSNTTSTEYLYNLTPKLVLILCEKKRCVFLNSFFKNQKLFYFLLFS